MYSTWKTLVCRVSSMSLVLVLLLLSDLALAATFCHSTRGSDQPFESITQEEFDRLIVESEEIWRRHRQELEPEPDRPARNETWQPPQERVNGFRHGIAIRAGYLVDRPYRLVPPQLSPTVQEMLKKEVTAIRGRSTENLVLAVDVKSIYELRSQGLSYHFPDWVFVVIPRLRAQARPDQPREIMYGVLPEFYTYAFREADGDVFVLAEGEWFDGFDNFAKKCGVRVTGRRDAGLLWNAYAAFCHERPALITVRELQFGIWNITSESWKGRSLDIITDCQGRLQNFIRKEPGGADGPGV